MTALTQPGITIAKQANALGRKSTDARLLARLFTRQAIATLAALMRESKSEQIRKDCAEALLNRGHGRPAQALIHMTAGDDRPAALDFLGELFGLDAQAPTIIDADPVQVAIQARAVPVYASGLWFRGMSS